MNKLHHYNDKLLKENVKLKKQMAEKDKQIIGMKEEIDKLKEQMAKMEANLKKRRALPAELLNEMFFSMPLENSIKLLSKMPNGLLARNAQKMINDFKMALKGNKWNKADCGSKLTISEDGLIATHSGPNGKNAVRANLPLPLFSFNLGIKNSSIVFYIEMEILKKPCDDDCNSGIGVCIKKHNLEEEENHSVEDNDEINIAEIKKLEVMGFGIIHHANSSIKGFHTYNGELRGKSESPPTLAGHQLFPFASLYNDGSSIRANFGKDEWRFKQFKQLLEGND